jgi:hypothetical protein
MANKTTLTVTLYNQDAPNVPCVCSQLDYLSAYNVISAFLAGYDRRYIKHGVPTTESYLTAHGARIDLAEFLQQLKNPNCPRISWNSPMGFSVDVEKVQL